MTNPIIMLLAAAIFGYFGFAVGMTPHGPANEFVFMFALLLWTLRIGAIAFAVAAAVSFANKLIGNIVYCISGLGVAIALALVGVMDIIDQQYAAALPPILAFIFAIWNGYGSWVGLQEIRAGLASGTQSSGRPLHANVGDR